MMIYIYCDESNQDLLATQRTEIGKKYCCIGGLMIPVDSRISIKKKIEVLKKRHNIHGEIRWGSVSPNKISFYLELVDLFFDTPDMFLRTVVIDASKICNDIFNENDHELGYYKFYYQLLYHWLRFDNEYRVYTDQKTNKDKNRLKDLRRIVNIMFPSSNPLRSIQAIDSRESLILQMQNILMGAVGYKYNYSDDGVSLAKVQVVARVESHLQRKIGKTSPNEQKFNVFEIALREER